MGLSFDAPEPRAEPLRNRHAESSKGLLLALILGLASLLPPEGSTLPSCENAEEYEEEDPDYSGDSNEDDQALGH